MSHVISLDTDNLKSSYQLVTRCDSKEQSLNILVVIDPGVTDYQMLAAGVVAGARTLILDANRDGIEQITEALQSKSNTSLHLVSHGSPGCLYLGNTQLSLDTLESYTEELQSWFLSSLILYGCNVAAGDAGAEFIEQLHQITKAQIAASNKPVGSNALGGDWELGVRIGAANVDFAFQISVIQEYSHTLNTAPTLTANATLSSVNEDTINPLGRTVLELFGDLVSDNDTDEPLGGIAVVSNTATTTQGKWQYSTDGSTWFDIGSVNDGTNALALSQDTKVRFLPGSNFNGTPSPLQLRAIDNTYALGYTIGGNRVNINTTNNGGSTLISQEIGSLTIKINSVNDVPIAGTIPNQAAKANIPFNFKLPSNVFTDPDIATNGDVLTLTTGAGLPKWLSFNAATQTFSGTPGNGNVGTVSVKVKATDSDAETAETTFVINVAPPDGGIVGTNSNENYTATSGSDFIDASGGNDTIVTTFANLQQNDTFSGGAGTDTFILSGGTSSNTITINLATSSNQLQGIGSTTVSNFEIFKLEHFVGNVTFTGTSGNDTFVSGAGNDTLNGGLGNDNFYGGSGNDTLNGDAGNDQLDGGAGNDFIYGGAGNDQLQGSAGNDTLIGGDGNDSYYVDAVGDSIQESSTGGIDTVSASISYSFLGTNLENLYLIGNNAIDGTGNAANNYILGNSAINMLSGNEGNDTLDGGAGNDKLDGGAGNDTLNGGSGIDILIGGDGNDIYYVDDINDSIQETDTGGIDIVYASVNYTLGTNVDNITLLGSNAINGTGNSNNNYMLGNSSANILTGGDGNDILNGAAGNDTLIGGNGNDIYYVDANDIVNEIGTSGTDTVFASLSFTLSDNVENLYLSGNAVNGTGNASNNYITGHSGVNFLFGEDGNDTLEGNGGDDTLDGGNGNDSLVGGAGSDTMIGGNGDDIYYVDSASDIIKGETSTGGIDIVRAFTSYVLPTYVENLYLIGSNAVNGTGNASDNNIGANSLANNLSGGDGNDSLFGDSGNDTLDGGSGNDILTGGLDSDRFLFNSNAAFVASAVGIDRISDFTSNSDKIILDKTTFTALNSGVGIGFNVTNEFAIVTDDFAASISTAKIVYNSGNGKLFYNQDGVTSGFGTGAQFATIANNPSLTGNDFEIVS